MIRYEFSYKTYSADASPAALQGHVYWYATESTENSETVYYDTTDSYARWYTGAIWAITAIADVGGSLVDYFEESGDSLIAHGAFTGSGTISSVVISDAWYRAEETAFDSLKDFLGCTEGRECFRGFLPVSGDGDDLLTSNVWQMTSGGSGEYDTDRFYVGDNAAWCSLRTDVLLDSVWRTREEAQKFAGAVMAWLRSTNNLKETGNIKWCVMTDVPGEPAIYRTDGENRKRLWKQEINLELIYRTESNY